MMITDDLLDRLKMVESSGDPRAVNKTTGAMGAYQFMPDTVKMLEAQGVKFDPFNEPQAREAARFYLGQLMQQNKGDLDKSLAAYGGFKSKDPTAYVQKVKGSPMSELDQFLANRLKTTETAPQASFGNLDQFLANRLKTAEEAPAKAAAEQQRILQAAVPVLDASGRLVREAPAPVKPRQIKSVADFFEAPIGMAETALNLGTGAVVAPLAAGEQLVRNVIEGQPNTRTDVFAKRMGQFVYQPRTEFGQENVQQIGKAFEASKLPPVLTPEFMALGQTRVPSATELRNKPFVDRSQTGLSVAGANIPGTSGVLSGEMIGAAQDVLTRQGFEPKPRYTGPELAQLSEIVKGTSPLLEKYNQQLGSVGLKSAGAAARNNPARIEAAINSLPIEYQDIARQQVRKAGGPERANAQALENEAKALNLPVPVRLLPGQASDDLIVKAYEYNNRAALPKVQERFTNQPNELIQNVSELQNIAAPNVFDKRPASIGQSIRTNYERFDDQLNKQIDAKYQTLRDAAGGSFPIDTKQLYQNIKQKLDNELLFEEAPKSQIAKVELFAQNGSMTFQQFLALRKNLSRLSADKNVDGNTRTAAGMMVAELDQLPMSLENAALRSLAEDARAAAKARFDMLDPTKPSFDPMYKAVLDRKVANEHLFTDFIVGKKGSEAALQQMIANMGPDGREIVAAGLMEEIKKRAIGKTSDNKAEFKPAAYKKAIDDLEPKLRQAIGNELFQKLQDVADVSAMTLTREKAGAYGLSGTLPGSLLQQAVEKGVEKLTQAGNVAAFSQGVPVPAGSMVGEFLAKRKIQKQEKKLTAPFASVNQVKLKDIGK